MAQISDLRYESNVALVSSSLKRFWWDSNVRLKSRSKPTFDNPFRYSISILRPRHARISKSAFLYGNLSLDSGPFFRKYESLFVSFQSKIKKGLLFQMIYSESGFFRSYLKKKNRHPWGDMIQGCCFIRIREEGIYRATIFWNWAGIRQQIDHCKQTLKTYFP